MGTKTKKHHFFVGAALAVCAVFAAAAAPAMAVPAGEIGVYPTWQTAGSAGAYTGSATFSPSAGFPAVSVTSNSTTVKAPSGESAWLGSSTGFGQEYGSSRSQPYLYLSTAAGQAPSVTHLDFATPPPAGWGFALGDIDADWVFVQAWKDSSRTQPLTVPELGFQEAGNSCANVPKPSSCATGPFTDAPVWVTAPETFDGVSYVPGTLRGNSMPGSPAPTRDTAGAYGWFSPTVPVAAIDFMFGARDGFPIYQLWLAAPAPAVTITGVVELPDAPGAPIPDGTVVQLNAQDGTPVLDIEDKPVVVPVAPDGTFTVEGEQRDFYELAVVPPAGYTPPAPVLVAANTATAIAPPLKIEPVVATPAPVEATPAVAANVLAATGFGLSPWLIAAGVLLLLGIALFVINLVGRRRERVESEKLAAAASDIAGEDPEHTRD